MSFRTTYEGSTMKRNLVCTFTAGDVPYARLTLPTIREYAYRVGADYRRYEFPRTPLHKETWFRHDVIRVLARSGYEGVAILDADVVVTRRCPDVFALLEDRPLAVPDMGRPLVTDDYVRWYERQRGHAPMHSRYVNAGVLVARPEHLARLDAELVAPRDRFVLHEQHSLNAALHADPRRPPTYLPPAWNWMAPQFPEASDAQFVVHFAGSHKDLISSFVERHWGRHDA